MRKQFIVNYGGGISTYTQQPSPSTLWSYVLTHNTARRVDGYDMDSTAVLFALFNHLSVNKGSDVLSINTLDD